ncbi:MAG: monovalent cation/H+ antiporter complex subunit F [Gemmatimonadota bacterium]
MSAVLVAAAMFVSLLIGANLIRVASGPTIYDRLLGIGVIGTDVLLLLVLIGFIFGRPDGFMDLAITYAILNFVGVIAVAKFLDAKRGSVPRGGDR